MEYVKQTKEQGVTHTECEEVSRMMQRKYAAHLQDRSFEVVSSVHADGVYVTITLRSDSGAFVYPVEGRIKYKEQNLKATEAAHILFDYIDLYFEEYLKESEGVYLPIDWSDFKLEEVELQLKGQVRNEKLEQLADDWLAGRGQGELH